MGLKSPNGPITSVEQYFESKKIMENMTPGNYKKCQSDNVAYIKTVYLKKIN
jgi:hypothetical protein